jgi:hypothetical protein
MGRGECEEVADEYPVLVEVGYEDDTLNPGIVAAEKGDQRLDDFRCDDPNW